MFKNLSLLFFTELCSAKKLFKKKNKTAKKGHKAFSFSLFVCMLTLMGIIKMALIWRSWGDEQF